MFSDPCLPRSAALSRSPMSPGRGLVIMLVSLAVSLMAASTRAHHSMTAFDKEQWFTEAGVLVEIEFVNPHVFLVVDIENEDGVVETWRLEGPATRYFNNVGFFKGDVEASLGKNVTVEISPAHDGSRVGLLRQLTLASGDVISACPLQC